ncbi:GGDEF domain-containing response regulator [Clostridium grantii]|uniref:Stage 0 sporulation protein A homolog n=1 Tax=Clostridium grantii DSM 8605 TaxID=1121316 RepID=A0A1M5T5L6_9CLOT|nr:diguanylate cyclase [Clostridium grantii]SHH46057.1 diguanylate cyclase (GGDEF) domain-containing protein [Clostridium grantii DSM 8605]
MDKEVLLVIDDNENDYLIIKRFLGDKYRIKYDNGQANPEVIMNTIKEVAPVCILLDYNLGGLQGIEMLKILQSDEEYKNISVIMLTNEIDPNIIVDCIKNNAENYLIKDDLGKNDLRLAVKRAITESKLNNKIEEQHKEIIRLSRIDDLTGLYNRRWFIEKVEEEIKRLNRSHNTISITIIDLDYFKLVNDNYGHLIGDEVLKIAGKIIAESVRSTDIVCRYGGDEFTLCLVEALDENMSNIINNQILILKKISQKIEKEINEYLKTAKYLKLSDVSSQRQYFRVTASVGTTFLSGKLVEFYDLFRIADQCLYLVKESGRNNIAYSDYNIQKPILINRKDCLND